MDFGLDLFDQWLSNVSWIILHVSINMGGNMDTLYIYFRRTSWQVGDTPKPKILIEIHVGGGGWVKFKVNLQIWSRTNIFTHSEENTFICKLYKYSSTPAICFNEPMFVQEKSDYCKKCNLSFIPSLHFTSHMLVHSGGKPSRASLVRFPGPHYIVSRGTWIGQAMQCLFQKSIFLTNLISNISWKNIFVFHQYSATMWHHL